MALNITKPREAAADNIKVIVYGSSSAGKTKFSTNFNKKDSGKVLLIDLEKGSASATNQDIDMVRVDSAAEFKTVLTELQEDTKYHSIIVDSATKYSEMLYDVLKAADPDRKNGMAVYGDYDRLMKSNMNLLLTLKKNIIVTAIDDLVLHEDYRKSFPLVVGQKYKVSMIKEFDYVFYMHVDADGVRHLKTNSTNEYIAKDRFGFLPEEIVSDYDTETKTEKNKMFGIGEIIKFTAEQHKKQG